jgi:DNA-binding PadR family transcriptional regulator
MGGDQVKGQLDLLVLAALQVEAMHGYALIERLRSGSAGAFDLAEGTIYPALHRLEGSGLLRSSWSDVGGRRRRVYALTARGRGALDEQRRDWRTFARAVDGIVGGAA